MKGTNSPSLSGREGDLLPAGSLETKRSGCARSFLQEGWVMHRGLYVRMSFFVFAS